MESIHSLPRAESPYQAAAETLVQRQGIGIFPEVMRILAEAFYFTNDFRVSSARKHPLNIETELAVTTERRIEKLSLHDGNGLPQPGRSSHTSIAFKEQGRRTKFLKQVARIDNGR